MQTCGHNFGKSYMIWQRRGILVEVEHVKAHRTKKEEEKVTQLGMFVTEGNENADELAKSRSNVGRRIHGRSENVALQYAARKDCEELMPKPKEKWIFVDKKSEETKHRTEWCAEADRYRCMRCGR